MELRQLRYFVGIAEAGSLLKASARLHIAQPALGQQMAALEGELGAQLFVRSSRGMSLTEAGTAFLDHARIVLADVERARSVVKDSTAIPSGDVVIGLTNTIALAATVPIVLACRERLPQVRLRVVEAYSGHLREWLQSGRLDLAFLFGDAEDPALIKRPLLEEPLALVTDIRGPRLPARISLARAIAHPLVLPSPEHGLRRIIDEACAAQSLVPNVVAEIDSLPSVKRTVEAGLGFTILSLGSVAEEVEMGRMRAVTINDTRMLRRVVIATSVTRPTTIASRAVCDLACDVVKMKVQAGDWPGRWIGAERPKH